MAETNDYCNSLFISTVKNELCLSNWRRLCVLWLRRSPSLNECVTSNQTWHKLPTYYKRWLKYFIYSADSICGAYCGDAFSTSKFRWKKKHNTDDVRNRRKKISDKDIGGARKSIETSLAAHCAQWIAAIGKKNTK